MATQPYGIRQSYTFQDHRGFKAVTRVYFPQSGRATAAADAEALAGALKNISHSAFVLNDAGDTSIIKSNGVFTSTAQPLAGATTGFYASVADKLVMLFKDAAGFLHKYQIPAPLETVWLGDDTEALRTNALVTAVSDLMVDIVASGSGFLLTSFVGAYRSRTQTPRRLSTSILDNATPQNIVWP